MLETSRINAIVFALIRSRQKREIERISKSIIEKLKLQDYSRKIQARIQFLKNLKEVTNKKL